MTKLNSLLIPIISIIIVLFHIYIGHYYAPHGIDLLPITMILVTIMIFQFTNLKIYFKLVITAILFLMLDVGIKLYSGGTHDVEGLEWMYAFYFIGLILCLPIILYKIFKNAGINTTTKILLVILFIAFLYFQKNIFWDLGLGRDYPIN